LSRQQWLILLAEKDQQVLQLGKTITITKRSHPDTCIHMHGEVALDLSELFRRKIFVLLLCCFVFITPMFTIFSREHGVLRRL
jgi:hypothetical protein